MTKERLHVSLDPEQKIELERRANLHQRTISEEISLLISVTDPDPDRDEIKTKVNTLLAIARKNEREIRVLKGMMNGGQNDKRKNTNQH